MKTWGNILQNIVILQSQYLTKLSAFITGRSYTGEINNGTYDDDLDDANENQDDMNMNGLYIIFDPSNDLQDTDYPFYVPRKEAYYGFNELQRRKTDLCQLINNSCGINNLGSKVASVVLEINKNMLNPEGH